MNIDPAMWLIVGGLLMLSVGTAKRIRIDEQALMAAVGGDRQKALTVGALVQRFEEQRVLTPYEIAGMLAIAYREGGFDMTARSPDQAPDAAGGHAWGTFQFLKKTLTGLGVPLEQVTPIRGPDGVIPDAEIVRAARGSADAALKFLLYKPGWTGGRPYLVAIRALHPGKPSAVLREIFVAWAGGVSRTFADIADVPYDTTPGTLGFIHRTIERKFGALPIFLEVLGLNGRRS